MPDSEPFVVLVTGTSSGFGRLISLELARRGHQVYASMRDPDGRNAAGRRALTDVARRERLDLVVTELDVTDEASVAAAVAAVVGGAGRIDAVVNNAGRGAWGLNEAFEIDQVRALFDVNVFGALRVNRAVLPHLRAQGSGLLVQMGSVLGRVVWPLTGVYAATKHALEAIAESYRYDLARLGIDSVVVEPGAYPTGLAGDSMMLPADRDRSKAYGEFRHAVAGDRFVAHDPDPQDVATAVADLVAMTPGTRPLRTTVGIDTKGADEINQASAAAHRQLYDDLGLRSMLSVPGERLP